MTLILALLTLPYLAWSWARHGADEDAMATLSIIGWALVVSTALGAWWIAA